jgi:hypothetical protein
MLLSYPLLERRATPFQKLFNHLSEVAESFQVEQGWFLACKILGSRCVGRPTGGNGSMIAIKVSNDQIRIKTSTYTNDLDLLTAKRMMRMDHRYPFRNSLG